MRTNRLKAVFYRQLVSLAAIWSASTLFPVYADAQGPGLSSSYPLPTAPANQDTSLLPDLSLAPAQTAAAPTRGKLVVDVVATVSGSNKSIEMERHIQTRKGQEFDPERVQGDIRRLIQSGLYREVKPYTKDTPGGVIVIYEAFERPRIKYIKQVGNRGLSDKKLTKEHGLKVGDAINAFNTEEARRKLEEKYKKEGYTKATVSIFEGDKSTDRGVVFYINEGQIQRISKVEFVGNTPELVTDSRLYTQIQSKPGYLYYFIRGKVDRNKIDADVEKLTAYYRNLGYFRARVDRELEYDEAGKWLTLRYVIDEGPRYVVRNVTIDGNTKFANAPLLEHLKLKSGQYFNQGEMNADISTMQDLYGSQGHVYADVQADPRFLEEPGQLDLVYHIKEGDVFRVGEVNVHIGAETAGSSSHTRQNVVLNRVELRPGDIIDTRKLRDSERRLKSSGLFETNPSEGEAPRIVVKSPDLNSIGNTGKQPPRRGTVRSQTPESAAVTDPRYTAQNNQTGLPPAKAQQGPYSAAAKPEAAPPAATPAPVSSSRYARPSP